MSYVGQVADTIRNGRGTYTFPNPYFKYTGDWVSGKMMGNGVLLLADGGSYEGQFENGEMIGSGIRRFKDGSTYSGQFYLGEAQGQGTFVGAHGDKHIGAYENNQRHGRGEMRTKEGHEYVGEFKFHKYDGEGSMLFENGDKYQGGWKNGEFDGDGIFEAKDGGRYEGRFENGRFEGQGGLLLQCRYSYQGEWKDNERIQVAELLKVKDNVVLELQPGEMIPMLTVECVLDKNTGTEEGNEDTEVCGLESGRKLSVELYEQVHGQLNQVDFYTIDKDYVPKADGDVPKADSDVPKADDATTADDDAFAGYCRTRCETVYTKNGMVEIDGLRLPESEHLNWTLKITDTTNGALSNVYNISDIGTCSITIGAKNSKRGK